MLQPSATTASVQAHRAGELGQVRHGTGIAASFGRASINRSGGYPRAALGWAISVERLRSTPDRRPQTPT
jgi:hypothetical protein